MCEDINAIVGRANIVYENEPGFIDCRVESEIPQVLAYQFYSAMEAEQFRLTRNIQAP